jgi:hypothetical protein
MKLLAALAMLPCLAMADGTYTFYGVTFGDGVMAERCEEVTFITRNCVPVVVHPPTPHPDQLVLTNVSLRGRVGLGDDVLIMGFIIPPGSPRSVTILARGPSLAPHGIKDHLQDPVLTVVNQTTGQVIDRNDNWQELGRAPSIIGSGHPPSDPREAATVLTLQPGPYTAIVSGKGKDTGVAIVELFPR